MTSDASLRGTFDEAAGLYRSARPRYPDELFDDLETLTGLTSSSRLLEIGCGPGVATQPLAERGYAITALELGPRLAIEARHNLAAYPQVEVVTTSFEEWAPPAGAAFDLVYAATSWHWIDPETRWARAAAVLRPGGHLAVFGAGHAFPEGFDPFFTAIQPVYESLGEKPEPWPPPTPDEVPWRTEDYEASGHFAVVAQRRYVWAQRYTADRYLALLDTFSGHIAMPAEKRDHLYGEIRRMLAERPDGQLTRHWISSLTIARRLGPDED